MQKSSASDLLSGWAPEGHPRLQGRTISHVVKLPTRTGRSSSTRRRIYFRNGSSLNVQKQMIAHLARQKGSILASEKRQGLKKRLNTLPPGSPQHQATQTQYKAAVRRHRTNQWKSFKRKLLFWRD